MKLLTSPARAWRIFCRVPLEFDLYMLIDTIRGIGLVTAKKKPPRRQASEGYQSFPPFTVNHPDQHCGNCHALISGTPGSSLLSTLPPIQRMTVARLWSNDLLPIDCCPNIRHVQRASGFQHMASGNRMQDRRKYNDRRNTTTVTNPVGRTHYRSCHLVNRVGRSVNRRMSKSSTIAFASCRMTL